MRKLLAALVATLIIGFPKVYAHPLVALSVAPTTATKAITPITASSLVIFSTNLPFLITLDDGYSRPALKALIALRREHKQDFICLLFPYGKALHDNADLFVQLVREGCEVHNHTYHHVYFRNVPYVKQEREILLADREIEAFYKYANVQRPKVKYFRPPGELYDSNTKAICVKLGYRIMLWNAVSYRGKEPVSVETRVANLLRAKRGSIILLHITNADIEALRLALPVLLKVHGSIH
ncbi:polysaccharide deacetylase family protein [Coprothermobacteraceae bacterium]|nr:polysaccharide deacetylase family protein [Coprothermobacteraceae bacterium]